MVKHHSLSQPDSQHSPLHNHGYMHVRLLRYMVSLRSRISRKAGFASEAELVVLELPCRVRLQHLLA